jgi:Rps23 Pro-64 3,4-dihydroxylase Tpa1-like proline 4-hydroxylase
MFGDWKNHISEYTAAFAQSQPYQHVIIPNFFSDYIADALSEEFPDPLNSKLDWKHYDNPIEQKYALNDFVGLLPTRAVFEYLAEPAVVSLFRDITSIPNLEADPHLHGAGLHAYPRNGKLDVHLDYSVHPISGKERRVNLIVYLNKDWKTEYGGGLQLWNSTLTECKEIIAPEWNTAVLFRTNEISYHGLPAPLQCPDGKYRRSLAVYYISNPTSTVEQPVDSRLKRLYDIRKNRLITADDLADWPTWREDGGGYW